MEAATPVQAPADLHATSVVTWDVPPAIVAGERFMMKVGVKCASECVLAGGVVGIFDHEGTGIATGTLRAEHWPGTTGLHVVEVELQAPAEPGFYTWSARGLESNGGARHAQGAATFGVRVVGRPEYVVRVEAVDKETGAALAGARIVMHPYRTVADGHGVAHVRVAAGSYTLFVSLTGHVTVGAPVEVTGDVTTRVELSIEPESERN